MELAAGQWELALALVPVLELGSAGSFALVVPFAPDGPFAQQVQNLGHDGTRK
jgi:hypothetical protein